MIITTKRERERERTSSGGRQHIMGTVVSDSRAHKRGLNWELKPRKYSRYKRQGQHKRVVKQYFHLGTIVLKIVPKIASIVLS